jgi:hypothetical protein
MGRYRAPTFGLLAVAATLVIPAAEAKFRVTLSFKPVRPVVRQPARLTMRTDVVLPRGQSISVVAVGPWRKNAGQRILDVPLVRTGARRFDVRLRFPYPGKWRLQMVSEAGLPPIGRLVKVRPPG